MPKEIELDYCSEERLSKVYEYYIVGSALTKKEPRDIDMFGIMDDFLFTATFHLEPEEFSLLLELGEDIQKDRWRDECTGATRVLQSMYSQIIPLDFKWLPRSILQKPYKEIDLTKAPETWGIGLPNLLKHDDSLLLKDF